MESGKSNFLIGLGVGSVIGALVYRFWHSPKGKRVKEKVNHAFQKVTGAEFTKAWANELGGKIFPDEYAVATKIIEIHEENKPVN